MPAPIINGRSQLLPGASASLPNVNNALAGWQQPMQFIVVTKSVVNFKNVETSVITNFQGVIVPFTAQQLLIKPEGQRGPKWQMLYADPSLDLKLDDQVLYQGRTFRVKGLSDYSQYGYLQYELQEDNDGVNP